MAPVSSSVSARVRSWWRRRALTSVSSKVATIIGSTPYSAASSELNGSGTYIRSGRAGPVSASVNARRAMQDTTSATIDAPSAASVMSRGLSTRPRVSQTTNDAMKARPSAKLRPKLRRSIASAQPSASALAITSATIQRNGRPLPCTSPSPLPISTMPANVPKASENCAAGCDAAVPSPAGNNPTPSTTNPQPHSRKACRVRSSLVSAMRSIAAPTSEPAPQIR